MSFARRAVNITGFKRIVSNRHRRSGLGDELTLEIETETEGVVVASHLMRSNGVFSSKVKALHGVRGERNFLKNDDSLFVDGINVQLGSIRVNPDEVFRV